MAFQQMSSKSSQVGIRIRAALLTAVYQKAMSLDMDELNAGDVVNLATNDCSRLMESCSSFHFLWGSTLECMGIVGLLVYMVGPVGWIALGIVVVLLVLQSVTGKIVTSLRSKNINATDRRVSLMTEILMSAKLVKLYAWEEFFAAKVKRVRRKEFFMMFSRFLIKTINLTMLFSVPLLIPLAIFAVYIHKNGQLSPPVAFTTLSLFNALRFPILILPKALQGFAESISAIPRLQGFLLKDEMQVQPRESNYYGIKMENACFSYLHTEELLHNISFELPKGKLCAIVGLVTSGKTNLICSILGQMKLKSGKCKVGEGKIGYVSQVPWIQNGTIRGNILFGNSYDEARYKETVFACCLERDFAVMPDGDNTELSDRGANLSGGQKQRIALARAVYSNADMYLLDSPLSSVDQHTAIHIFEHCIRGMLKEKTVLLVSHHFELLQECHLVAVMDNGSMKYFGEFNHEALHCVKRYFPHWMFEESKLDRKVVELIPEELPVVDLPDTPTDHVSDEEQCSFLIEESKEVEGDLNVKGLQEAPAAAPLVMDIEVDQNDELVIPDSTKGIDEKIHKKRKRRVLPFYGHYVWLRESGFFLVFITLAMFSFSQAARVIAARWIGWWTADQYHLLTGQYIWIYSVLVAVCFVALFLRGIAFYAMALRCSTRLHNRMFKSILRAPMQFYYETPVGRILNCFSKDQDTVDETLPETIHITLIYFMVFLTTVVIIGMMIPLYSVVLVVLVVSFTVMYFLYSNPASSLKERSGSTDSLIFSHLNESLTGLALIRAFGEKKRFESEYIQKIDDNHRATFTGEQLQLWLSFRLDIVSSICVFISAIFAIVDRGPMNASSFGVAISTSFQQLVFFTWVVRGFAEINGQIACMERLNNYARHVKPEAEARIRTTEPSGIWPSEGRVFIDSLFLRYSAHTPTVLKGVTLEIKPAEKIGIVGRTGSGKTSLLMSFFRLLEPESGHITIDGINISTLGLSDLRSRIAIIPQEPVLFMGTIRSNLDPFNKHTDDEIWDALECANLKAVVQEMPSQLNNIVLENGSNYSLGQKQLFCLSRAVLSQSKLLVFDEATAAMDLETDTMIQRTIRNVFANRTILTIAHRLDTVIDSDRIIVMEAGHVVEFDTPTNLLSNREGIFTKLVEQTGPDSATALRKIALRHIPSHS